MANVSKLLHTETDRENFLANLRADDTLLRDAKRKIRARLRAAFSESSRDRFGQEIRPRFFTQGSSSYKTLNDPAWPPEQQKDLDDGCYLPLSFVRGERPSKAAALFFQFVEGVLGKLAGEEGWTLNTEKDSCVRLEIASDAHVDIPLYAIPDREFRLLEDKAVLHAQRDAKATPDHWEALPSDAVLLAHRKENWVESDPRKINDWFLKEVEFWRERLRRDCRFMKAWRDHHHLDRDHLSSIMLMACVWSAYEVIRAPFLPDREDERLLRVAEKMPVMLRKAMPNPACPSEDLNRMSQEERARVAGKAEELRDFLKEAVERCSDKDRAVGIMRDAFGDRLPNRPDLVTIPVTAEATIRSHSKQQTPAPEVGRSKSG